MRVMTKSREHTMTYLTQENLLRLVPVLVLSESICPHLGVARSVVQLLDDLHLGLCSLLSLFHSFTYVGITSLGRLTPTQLYLVARWLAHVLLSKLQVVMDGVLSC